MTLISPDPATILIEDRAPGKFTWWYVLVGLCAVILAPLALVDVPPLLDYPNHLARLFVLGLNGADPAVARFYRPHWALIPNLGLDLTVPPFLRLFPVHDVGRVAIGFVLLLPVLGAAAWHRATFRRLSYWPLTAVLFTYNGASLRGFLNFVAAIGLALLIAAPWAAWRQSHPTRAVAIAASGAVALYFCHLTGLVFLGVLIGGSEVAWLNDNRRGWREIPARLAALALVFVAPVGLYYMSSLGHLDDAAEFRSVVGKAQAAMIPVINYWWPLDLITAVLGTSVPLLCLVKGWCRVHLGAAVSMITLLGLFVALPTAFKGTFDLDSRFIVMAAALAPAAMIPVAMPRGVRRGLTAGFLLLFGVRMAILALAWHGWAQDLTAFRAVIAPVQPGDAVLTIRLPQETAGSLWTAGINPRRLSDGTVVDSHLPALLLIERRAWWPFLFDNPSQQPIETLEPFRSLAERIDRSRDPVALLARDAGDMAAITHVLIVGQGSITTEHLRLLIQSPEASLFAVTRNQTNR